MGIVRLLLALSVVAAHAGPYLGYFTLVNGSAAVEAFFIVSGFYMTLILNEKYVGSGSYKLFFSNRILKLFPVYWTIALLTLVISVGAFLLSDNSELLSIYKQNYDSMNITSLFYIIITNIIIFGQDAVMFLQLDTNGFLSFTSNYQDTVPQLYKFMLIPPAWSLSSELLFYALAPFIVRDVRKILLLITVSLAIKGYILLVVGWYHDPWSYRFFPSEFSYFLMGSLSYLIYSKYIKNKLKNTLYGKLSLILISLFILVFESIPLPGLIKQNMFNAIVAFAIPFIFSWTSNIKWDRQIGELSYPIYLSHWLMISLFQMAKLDRYSFFSIIVALASLALSLVLTKMITNPLEQYRQRRVRRQQRTGSLQRSAVRKIT